MKKNMNKNILLGGLFLMLSAGIFISAGSVSASATVNGVSLNGANNLTAESGSKVVAEVSVSLTAGSSWKSTAYRLGNGDWKCVDTPDHVADFTGSESFLIPVPQNIGNNDVSVKVYSNNDCTDGLNSMASASLLSSLGGVGGGWVTTLLLVIIVGAAVYFITKSTTKKS